MGTSVIKPVDEIRIKGVKTYILPRSTATFQDYSVAEGFVAVVVAE